jgi:hypothetical protein
VRRAGLVSRNKRESVKQPIATRRSSSADPSTQTIASTLEIGHCAAAGAATREAEKTDGISMRKALASGGTISVSGRRNVPARAHAQTTCRIAALERRSNGWLARANVNN